MWNAEHLWPEVHNVRPAVALRHYFQRIKVL
jgi:hypothetical protein